MVAAGTKGVGQATIQAQIHARLVARMSMRFLRAQAHKVRNVTHAAAFRAAGLGRIVVDVAEILRARARLVAAAHQDSTEVDVPGCTQVHHHHQGAILKNICACGWRTFHTEREHVA